MLKKISAMQARQNLGSLMNEVSLKGDAFVIERSGKALVVMISIDQFKRLSSAKEDAIPTTTKRGLPIVSREKRIQILNDLSPLEHPEDSQEWIESIKSARYEKNTVPDLE